MDTVEIKEEVEVNIKKIILIKDKSKIITGMIANIIIITTIEITTIAILATKIIIEEVTNIGILKRQNLIITTRINITIINNMTIMVKKIRNLIVTQLEASEIKTIGMTRNQIQSNSKIEKPRIFHLLTKLEKNTI